MAACCVRRPFHACAAVLRGARVDRGVVRCQVGASQRRVWNGVRAFACARTRPVGSASASGSDGVVGAGGGGGEAVASDGAVPSHDVHVSVMLEQAVEAWTCGTSRRPGDPGVFIDGTCGAGGHTSELLRRDPAARVVGLDRDPERVEWLARHVKPEFGDRLALLHANYGRLTTALQGAGLPPQADGILLDVGVCSTHFDDGARGFAFMQDGPLDMRFGQTSSAATAADLVNHLPEAQLAQIFRDLGEERRARTAAAVIVERRAQQPFTRTADLAACLEARLRVRPRKGVPKRHAATKCFQALRIAVNHELRWLEKGVQECVRCLRPGAALAVITFHSLEARLVKQAFRRLEAEQQGRCIPRKPIRADPQEVATNPRARSATLRVFVANADGASDT